MLEESTTTPQRSPSKSKPLTFVATGEVIPLGGTPKAACDDTH